MQCVKSQHVSTAIESWLDWQAFSFLPHQSAHRLLLCSLDGESEGETTLANKTSRETVLCLARGQSHSACRDMDCDHSTHGVYLAISRTTREKFIPSFVFDFTFRKFGVVAAVFFFFFLFLFCCLFVCLFVLGGLFGVV